MASIWRGNAEAVMFGSKSERNRAGSLPCLTACTGRLDPRAPRPLGGVDIIARNLGERCGISHSFSVAFRTLFKADARPARPVPSPPAAVERGRHRARVDVALRDSRRRRVAGATVRRITEHLPPDGDLDAVVANTRDPAAQQSNAIGSWSFGEARRSWIGSDGAAGRCV